MADRTANLVNLQRSPPTLARIVLAPGDGIGPEVIGAARHILERAATGPAGPRLEFVEVEVGLDAYRRTGDGFSARARELLLEADAVLLGAIDGAALPAGVSNPLHLLRQALGRCASTQEVIAAIAEAVEGG